MWYVYLLYHPTAGRTYVGSTTDPQRRLRQHNKEIVGGARATSKAAPGWELDTVIGGFSNRSMACRWEALLKKRARGLTGRREAFMLVVDGVCPPSKRGKKYRVPVTVTLELVA